MQEKNLGKMTVRELEQIRASINLKSLQPKDNNLPADIKNKPFDNIVLQLSNSGLLLWRLLDTKSLFRGGKEYTFEAYYKKELSLKVNKLFDKYGTYTYEYYLDGVKCSYAKSGLLNQILASSNRVSEMDKEQGLLHHKAQLLIHRYKSSGGVSAIYHGGSVSPR